MFVKKRNNFQTNTRFSWNLGSCSCSWSVFKFVFMFMFAARVCVRVQFVVRGSAVRWTPVRCSVNAVRDQSWIRRWFDRDSMWCFRPRIFYLDPKKKVNIGAKVQIIEKQLFRTLKQFQNSGCWPAGGSLRGGGRLQSIKIQTCRF